LRAREGYQRSSHYSHDVRYKILQGEVGMRNQPSGQMHDLAVNSTKGATGGDVAIWPSAYADLRGGEKSFAGECAGDGLVGGTKRSDGLAIEGDFQSAWLADLDDDLVLGGDGAFKIGAQ
jgi:hypothetical protein